MWQILETRSKIPQLKMASSSMNSVVIEVLKTEGSTRNKDSKTLRRRLARFLDRLDFKEDTVFQGDQIDQVSSCLSSLLFFSPFSVYCYPCSPHPPPFPPSPSHLFFHLHLITFSPSFPSYLSPSAVSFCSSISFHPSPSFFCLPPYYPVLQPSSLTRS